MSDAAGETTEEGDGFGIQSDAAFVAATTVSCRQCGQAFEAICIHCHSGSVFGEPLVDFTVCNIQAMDGPLIEQLARWPNFAAEGPDPADPGDFINHCPGCGSPYDDALLHDEPEDPFFNIPAASDDVVRLFELRGLVRLNGDEHFAV